MCRDTLTVCQVRYASLHATLAPSYVFFLCHPLQPLLVCSNGIRCGIGISMFPVFTRRNTLVETSTRLDRRIFFSRICNSLQPLRYHLFDISFGLEISSNVFSSIKLFKKAFNVERILCFVRYAKKKSDVSRNRPYFIEATRMRYSRDILILLLLVAGASKSQP